MAHFLEWTTGSSVFTGNQGKALILSELVVHSPEWTTGSVDFAGNQEKTPILWEPVVHFLEWTTGSALFAGIRLSPYNCVKRKSQVISGTM